MNDQITELGLIDDEELMLDDAALALAGIDHPGTDLAPYQAMIDDIVTRLAETGIDAESPQTRAALLALPTRADGGHDRRAAVRCARRAAGAHHQAGWWP